MVVDDALEMVEVNVALEEEREEEVGLLLLLLLPSLAEEEQLPEDEEEEAADSSTAGLDCGSDGEEEPAVPRRSEMIGVAALEELSFFLLRSEDKPLLEGAGLVREAFTSERRVGVEVLLRQSRKLTIEEHTLEVELAGLGGLLRLPSLDTEGSLESSFNLLLSLLVSFLFAELSRVLRFGSAGGFSILGFSLPFSSFSFLCGVLLLTPEAGDPVLLASLVTSLAFRALETAAVVLGDRAASRGLSFSRMILVSAGVFTGFTTTVG